MSELPRHSEINADVSAENEITLSRVFDAPRELVWQMWTDPAHIVNWWGPRGFTNTTQKMNVAIGGQWQYTMHGPDGRDYENLITYLEVDKPNRLAYKHGGAEDFEPVNFHVTATFEPAGDGARQTRVTLRMVFSSARHKDLVIREYNAVEGGKQTMTRLGEYLDELRAADDRDASKTFVITRVVRAPRDVVFRAWTEREQLQQWFGPKGMTISHCTLDLRPGGMFYFEMLQPDGGIMRARWVFREIVPPSRLVFVSSFADEHGQLARSPFDDNWPMETLSTVTFEEHAGIGKGTVITLKWTPLGASEGEENIFVDGFASMTQGWTGTFEKLDEFLAGGTP